MNFSTFIIARFHSLVPWIPLWVAAIIAMAGLLSVVFAIQNVAIRLIEQHVNNRYPTWQSLFRRTRGVVRFGIVILAFSAVISVLPISIDVQTILRNALVAAFVLLAGWAAIVAVNTAADSFLNKLNLDATDNLLARKAVTQVRVLKRAVNTIIIVLTIAFALMTFQSVRQFGISIFASAGAAGIIVGLAARPVLANLIAGVQIALTQPIRIDDAVVLEGEWGWIEELNATYVVVRLWDRRRLIVPLSYFLEKPFQNWTRSSASIIGTVMLHLDYTAPIAAIRAKLNDIVAKSPLWDRDVVNLQVTDANDSTIEVRILVSAANSPAAWDLRCAVREEMLAYIQADLPLALPRRRNVTKFAAAPCEPAAGGAAL